MSILPKDPKSPPRPQILSILSPLIGQMLSTPLVEGRRTVGCEDTDRLRATVGQGEAKLGSDELLDVWSADVLGLLNLGHLKNVDRGKASSVPSSHVLVHRLDSSRPRKITVLLVHVVRARSRVVTEPDAKVLHLERLGLGDLS